MVGATRQTETALRSDARQTFEAMPAIGNRRLAGRGGAQRSLRIWSCRAMGKPCVAWTTVASSLPSRGLDTSEIVVALATFLSGLVGITLSRLTHNVLRAVFDVVANANAEEECHKA